MVRILDKEYKCAYKEIYLIIENLDEEIRNKIPKDKIEFYKNHMDNEHDFKLDFDKELSEQDMLYPTRCILANLFRDYIATEEDKTAILKEEQKEFNQIEAEKREKYNPDNIFKNNSNKIQEDTKTETSQIKIEEISTSTDMIVQNEKLSWFEIVKNKIISFISKIFKNN